jgi:hypothetical protein
MVTPFVFLSDLHAPFHDWRCVLLAFHRMQYLRPRLVVFGGDTMDCFLEGRFPRIGSRIHRLVEEIESAKMVLDVLSAAAPKARKIMLEGNHERRHKLAVATMGEVPGYLEGYPGISLAEGLGLKERGIEYKDSRSGNAWIKIGPLIFSHGDRYGAHPAAAELKDHKHSGMSGHVHRMDIARERSLSGGVDWMWLTSGTLARIAHYRDKNNEQQGFISGWLDEEANQFQMQHEVIHVEAEDYGRATLYAPEGTYYTVYAPTTKHGYVVRFSSNEKHTSLLGTAERNRKKEISKAPKNKPRNR